jgi:hypothetical protein
MWEDNIKANLKETGWEDLDWIHLTQNIDKLWTVVRTIKFVVQ